MKKRATGEHEARRQSLVEVNEVTPASRRRLQWALVVFVGVFGAAMAVVTPPGEAPDEPAHLWYADHMARTGVPPAAPLHFDGLNYEAHQPPGGYVLPALIIRLTGHPLNLAFERNPAFSFLPPGNPAFRHPAADGGTRRAVLAVRLANVLWLVLAASACTRLVEHVTASGSDPVFSWPYLLGPQLLFIGASAGNDAAVVALSSISILLLARFVLGATPRLGVLAGVAVTAALFCKGSALFLALPVAVTAARPFGERRRGATAALIGSAGAGLLLWLLVNHARFGSPLPPVPTAAGPAPSGAELLTNPSWILALFRSFWAKLGWLNTPLPVPFYAWFAILTALPVFGFLAGIRRGGRERDVTLVLAAALFGNLSLVVAYLLRVDWQPQGRYLFPSIAAAAALTSIAGLHVRARWQRPARVACAAAAGISALAAIATVAARLR